MKIPLVILLVALGACASSTSGSTGAESTVTSTTSPMTTISSTGPTTVPGAPTMLLSHEDIEGANHLLVGAVAADGDVVHAYVIAFNDAGQRIVHIEWPAGTGDLTQDPTNIEQLGFEFDRPGPIPTSLVSAGSRWLLYGHGIPLDDSTAGVFWAVSAARPGGPWERSPGIVMRAGAPGDWDHEWIDFPSVITEGDRYRMAYQGAGRLSSQRLTPASDIGVASSPDGAEWTKPDQPLLTAQQCEGAQSLVMPRLVSDDAGVALAYIPVSPLGDDSTIALDTAPAAEALGCGEVVLTDSDLPASGGIHSFGMFSVDEQLWLLVELLSTDSESSDLWLVPVERPH